MIMKIEKHNYLFLLVLCCSSFALTGNELNRAKKEGDRYFIYHVKNANTEKPTLSILLNPFKLIAENKIQTDPSEYIVGYIADHFDKQCL